MGQYKEKLVLLDAVNDLYGAREDKITHEESNSTVESFSIGKDIEQDNKTVKTVKDTENYMKEQQTTYWSHRSYRDNSGQQEKILEFKSENKWYQWDNKPTVQQY